VARTVRTLAAIVPQAIGGDGLGIGTALAPGALAAIPPELIQGEATLRQQATFVTEGVLRTRTEDREALGDLLGELTAEHASEPRTVVIQALDSADVSTFVRKHHDTFAAPAFDQMRRVNRGVRGRR
jgi:hypothetical protein